MTIQRNVFAIAILDFKPHTCQICGGPVNRNRMGKRKTKLCKSCSSRIQGYIGSFLQAPQNPRHYRSDGLFDEDFYYQYPVVEVDEN